MGTTPQLKIGKKRFTQDDESESFDRDDKNEVDDLIQEEMKSLAPEGKTQYMLT